MNTEDSEFLRLEHEALLRASQPKQFAECLALKIVKKVTVLPVITTLDLNVERVLQAAIDAQPTSVWVIGEAADGSLYFASSKSDGGDALWWMEKAKQALMEVST